MNVDFSKNYTEDFSPFEFEYERDKFDLNNESYSNEFNTFSSKMNSPNYISYETNEEFIENFLRIGNPIMKKNKIKKDSIDAYSHNKTTK